jgi:AAA15 family ATPase/GTPase
VLSALDEGALLVVDEVDSSLHPRLTAHLVELFRDKQINGRTAQLFFSTHDATLLGTNLGEEVLRRDEIWFVEKRDGASALYPLSDFHPRKEENRERRYLAGSYGAVPAIFTDSLVESVLATRTEPPDAQA